jgi:plastocyanin
MTRTPKLRLATAALACAAALPALAEGGAVAGKVETTPPKFLDETVVYLKGVKAPEAPKSASMDQKGLKFVPHVLVVAKGDTVKFLNHDNVAHNVYSPDVDPYNLGTFKQDEERTHTFTEEGAYTQLCALHPEMLGYIYVAPTRYAAVVDAKGRYDIKDVPPGSYEVAIWNAHLKGPSQKVTVAAGKTATADFALKR